MPTVAVVPVLTLVLTRSRWWWWVWHNFAFVLSAQHKRFRKPARECRHAREGPARATLFCTSYHFSYLPRHSQVRGPYMTHLFICRSGRRKTYIDMPKQSRKNGRRAWGYPTSLSCVRLAFVQGGQASRSHHRVGGQGWAGNRVHFTLHLDTEKTEKFSG